MPIERIQWIAIFFSLLFLAFIAQLIIKGKLREEYAFIWIICTLLLVVFSFWREGLEFLSELFGVKEAPNLVFTGAIGAICVYLLHLSIVNSKLQQNNKKLAQSMAELEKKVSELTFQHESDERS